MKQRVFYFRVKFCFVYCVFCNISSLRKAQGKSLGRVSHGSRKALYLADISAAGPGKRYSR